MRFNRIVFTLLLVLLLLTVGASVASAYPPGPSLDEIEKYLVIAMANDDDVRPMQLSCLELGSVRIVLSTPDSPTWTELDGCLPNLTDIFGNGRWDSSTSPDSVLNAATLFEGIDWSGSVALTSINSVFDSSDSVVFSDLGIASGRTSGSPMGSVSYTDSYPENVQTPVPNEISLSNGVSTGHDYTDLLSDLTAWKAFILSLPSDETITDLESPFDFTNNPASDGVGGLRTTFTNNNPADDAYIVVDFDLAGDFSMTNLDWVIDSAGGELIIFRILNGSNVTMQNSSILMHEFDFGTTDFLGALFFHASEGDGSSDSVFLIGNNTVINGIGFWDLNAVGEGGSTKTSIIINNGQGCAQFISQKVNLQNGRWVRCAPNAPTAITIESIEVQALSFPVSASLAVFGLIVVTTLAIMSRRFRQNSI